MKLSKFQMYWILVLLMLVWGNSFIAIKIGLQEVTPLELVVLRFVPSALMLLPFLMFSHRLEFFKLLKEEWPRVILMSFLSVFAYHWALNTGETKIPAGTAGLLVSLNPVFTFILSFLILKENISWPKVVGLIVAFSGVFIILRFANHPGTDSLEGIDNNFILGALITMLGPLCWSLYTVIGKSIANKYSATVVISGSVVIGTLPTLLLLSPELITRSFHLSPNSILSILFLALFCTVIGYLIWFKALQYLSPSEVAIFVYLNPLFALLSSKLILNESITLPLVIGGSLVILGVFFVNSVKTKPTPVEITKDF